jgi:hypothetical protein
LSGFDLISNGLVQADIENCQQARDRANDTAQKLQRQFQELNKTVRSAKGSYDGCRKTISRLERDIQSIHVKIEGSAPPSFIAENCFFPRVLCSIALLAHTFAPLSTFRVFARIRYHPTTGRLSCVARGNRTIGATADDRENVVGGRRTRCRLAPAEEETNYDYLETELQASQQELLELDQAADAATQREIDARAVGGHCPITLSGSSILQWFAPVHVPCSLTLYSMFRNGSARALLSPKCWISSSMSSFDRLQVRHEADLFGFFLCVSL